MKFRHCCPLRKNHFALLEKFTTAALQKILSTSVTCSASNQYTWKPHVDNIVPKVGDWKTSWNITITSIIVNWRNVIEETKLYCLDIAGIPLTKRCGSNTVKMGWWIKLFCSVVEPTTSAQAVVRILAIRYLSGGCVDECVLWEGRVWMLRKKWRFALHTSI